MQQLKNPRRSTIRIGESGGFSSGVASLSRAGLYAVGAFALALHDPDLSLQAREANAADVDCYIGLRIRRRAGRAAQQPFTRAFDTNPSPARRLAELVQQRLPFRTRPGGRWHSVGFALPRHRETQMPAIEVQLGEPSLCYATNLRSPAAAITVRTRELGHRKPRVKLELEGGRGTLSRWRDNLNQLCRRIRDLVTFDSDVKGAVS